ncbi:MAG: DUF4330 family protein, partial [Clostridia bacterium]|nr:DUF4330 family protein [Clostridia bacterium]
MKATQKKKITFIDVVIVLLIVCVFAGCFYYLFSKKIVQTNKEGNKFGYTLRLSDIEKEVADQVDVGD